MEGYVEKEEIPEPPDEVSEEPEAMGCADGQRMK